LLTRAKAQSAETAERLERLGAKVIYCPAIEFTDPESWGPVDSAVRNLTSFDWIIFTSANGVTFFMRRLAELRKQIPAGLEIAAIGPATAKALENAGVTASLMANDSKAEGALAAILEHLKGESGVSGLRFLLPRAQVARDYLPKELRRLGAQVDDVSVYRTVKPDLDFSEISKALTEKKIDAVTFTSSSTVSNLASLLGAEDLSRLMAGVLVACIGPITAKTAKEHGIASVLQPEVYTSEALVQAIARELSSKA
jgi:uroporphyrinogen III methyltransferase/synthase